MSDLAPEHEHEPQQVGHLLDQLGVKACLHEGDFVTDVVVIAKVHTKEGRTSVGVFTSENLQPYDRVAMITIAANHLGGH